MQILPMRRMVQIAMLRVLPLGTADASYITFVAKACRAGNVKGTTGGRKRYRRRSHLANKQATEVYCQRSQLGFKLNQGEHLMATITTKDGTQIYYKDWGQGQPVVFSHGWPLTADDWDGQMLFFGQHGYRVIAHDRRGHGRSSQTWDGNEMDTYADDLAALFEKLDLKDAIMVGHSTGGGEVARYLGRHGAKRVAKAVLISSVPPLMLKTENNPGGLPISAFDSLRAGTRSQPTAVLQGHHSAVLRI